MKKIIFAALLVLIIPAYAVAQGLFGFPIWPTPTQPSWTPGQQLFSNSSILNTQITGSAVFTPFSWPAPTGSNYLGGRSGTLDVPNPNVAPTVAVVTGGGWGNSAGTINIQITSGVTGGPPTDKHINIYQQSSGLLYNFWVFNRSSDTAATANQYAFTCITVGSACPSGAGTGFGTSVPFSGAGATAIGMSEIGGVVLASEVAAGVINHKLQITLLASICKSGFVPPAINTDCSAGSGIQLGQILAFPPSRAMPQGLSPIGQMVFTALKTYGAIAIDSSPTTTSVAIQDEILATSTKNNLSNDLNILIPLLQTCGPC